MDTKINANFDERAAVHSANINWLDSPMAGVSRKPLDRVGGEVARATSVVRYAPKSQFSPHVHTGGEEFLVLEGVFQDEHGDYPAGSYIRNPPQSRHTPGSEEGCVILVKLWQFAPTDRRHLVLNTNAMDTSVDELREGVSVIPLYADNSEEVSIQQWEEHTTVQIEANKGIEVFVLEGSFVEQQEEFTQSSWLRLPLGSKFTAVTGASGAKVWLKRGHLAQLDNEIQRIHEVKRSS
jgi:anti-sigma factor ChrR (cupin superfamily)